MFGIYASTCENMCRVKANFLDIRAKLFNEALAQQNPVNLNCSIEGESNQTNVYNIFAKLGGCRNDFIGKVYCKIMLYLYLYHYKVLNVVEFRENIVEVPRNANFKVFICKPIVYQGVLFQASLIMP